jgi:NADH:ubiquinone oxidoreductase subunit 4 (subunit M)
VILAGVLLKLGTFGFLRYAFWFFPKAAVAFLPALGLLAVIGIVYGALVAMVQTDVKRLVAYSSVSHLGFVMLGLCAMTVTGVTGSVLQMVNHGISTGALFLLVGVVYERRHTRELSDFGGLAKVMPVYAVLFVMAALSSIGLPGMNGFVGEFMILAGTFTSSGPELVFSNQSFAWFGIVALGVVGCLWVVWFAYAWKRSSVGMRNPKSLGYALTAAMALLTAALVMPPVGDTAGGLLVRPLTAFEGDASSFNNIFALLAVVAGTGVIFAAVYMLLATQKMFFGPLKHVENEHLQDVSAREGWILGVLMLVALGMGVYPQPFIDAIDPTVRAYVQEFRARAGLPDLDTTPVAQGVLKGGK